MNASVRASYGTLGAFPQSLSTWDCFGLSASDCFTTQFQFASNLYFSLAHGVTEPEFLVAPNTTVGAASFAGTGSWQGTYLQDKGSSYANPGFTNASCPTDNYTVSSLTAAKSIGFTPIDYESAGRTAPVLMAPTLEPGFPLQLPMDKCTFY
jgi:hypothetical protein